MASIEEIHAAKNTFNEHCTTHGCKVGECASRVTLWQCYMRAAEVWGGYKPDTKPYQDDMRGFL